VTAQRRVTLFAGLILTLLLGVSLWPVGPLPRLGDFLDPVRGVWTVARQAELPDRARAAIPGLSGAVTVHYDHRAVPHIFAANELDAIRALGYVVARDRLFEMELQWRAGAGRNGCSRATRSPPLRPSARPPVYLDITLFWTARCRHDH